MQSVVNSIHAGQLGDYTWIIDEIMIEEAKVLTESSQYSKPFASSENVHGIQMNTLNTVDINDLVSIIGSFFGASFVPPKGLPIEAKAQREKATSAYLKKLLKNSNKLYQTLNVATPDIEDPGVF